MGLFGSSFYETIIPGTCSECRNFAFSNFKNRKGKCEYYDEDIYPDYQGEDKCRKFYRIRSKSDCHYRSDGK